MLLSELFEEMDLEEGAKLVWARKGRELTKKYRCTDGKKQGRLVNNPADCGGPLDYKKKQKMEVLKKAKGKKMARKAKRTMRKNPTSRKLQRVNKSMR